MPRMRTRDDHARSAGRELLRLLRARRGQMRPADVGLPARSGRRTAGLGREDVAELLEVTPLWYALFESGSSDRRFSAAFIERVAHVLQLTEAEHRRIVALVVASGHASREVEVAFDAERWRTLRTEVTAAARRLAEAENDVAALGIARAAFAAIASLTLVRPENYLAAVSLERKNAPRVSGFGPPFML